MTGYRANSGGVANARRTRLGAGWVPAHHMEIREYEVTDGPVANSVRSRHEEDTAAGGGEA
ncbi:hypothetical protein ACN26Y_16275 [Micromonospora sp. WMMD558]|uniref:hypothetical protein n=1 Tax=unclassified Micromonospora TaxID=2617518 RepID=UPI0012B49DA1|nr:hypothetical protein [Micromonospora sp. WMMC415]QGN47680.1 hypothetical protein GKC29_13030 [Micromonospora sp. WMMC415]